MQPFVRITGPTAPLDRANVDTDQIVPKQFLKRIERTGFGEFLFYDWRREESDFILAQPRFRRALVLVAGANFGSGSSREHAPWALADWGYRVVIAPSFADIFRTNCGKIGLLCVELAPEHVRLLMDRAPDEVTVDLEAETVRLPDGRTLGFTIDPSTRERMLQGLDDISLTEKRWADISAYERDRERSGPNTLAV